MTRDPNGKMSVSNNTPNTLLSRVGGTAQSTTPGGRATAVEGGFKESTLQLKGGKITHVAKKKK